MLLHWGESQSAEPSRGLRAILSGGGGEVIEADFLGDEAKFAFC